MAINALVNGGSKAKQFLLAGGNPNFGSNGFIAYDGKHFVSNSGYGLYGKTYQPFDWCKVQANTSYGQSGCQITITITKACTVSVFSFMLDMTSTGNGKRTLVTNEAADVGKTYSIRHNDYNQGIGIAIVKEN